MLNPLRSGSRVSVKEHPWTVSEMTMAEIVLSTMGMIPGSFARSEPTSTTSGMSVRTDSLKLSPSETTIPLMDEKSASFAA